MQLCQPANLCAHESHVTTKIVLLDQGATLLIDTKVVVSVQPQFEVEMLQVEIFRYKKTCFCLEQ